MFTFESYSASCGQGSDPGYLWDGAIGETEGGVEDAARTARYLPPDPGKILYTSVLLYEVHSFCFIRCVPSKASNMGILWELCAGTIYVLVFDIYIR